MAPLTRSRVLHRSTVAAVTASALLALAACGALPAARPSQSASAARTTADTLPVDPVAPAIESATWINTEPLAWDSLRGQVVLVEFWTYSCINCQNVVPLMKSLHADYADRGFTLLSVHSPEYLYEKELANVNDAVEKAGITYPVAIDNDFANWNRYRNRYWPARYLVDKRGILRLTTIGEGGDAETRQWAACPPLDPSRLQRPHRPIPPLQRLEPPPRKLQ